MQGKTALITGATAGIGLRTAEALAERGADLLLVGRDAAKTERVAASLRAKGGTVTPFVADLSRQDAVRRLADEVRTKTERLDVLINNVGAIFQHRAESADGREMTFALNHLAPFLLTNLLLDLLQASAPARVVTVASAAHTWGTMDFTDLDYRKGYGGWNVYSRSKLANVLFAYELARRAAGTGVTSNSLHPGFVASDFGHNNGGLFGVTLKLTQRLFAISEEDGAKTSVHLASAFGVNEETGKYFVKSRPVASSKASYDESAWRRLWDVSAEMVGL